MTTTTLLRLELLLLLPVTNALSVTQHIFLFLPQLKNFAVRIFTLIQKICIFAHYKIKYFLRKAVVLSPLTSFSLFSSPLVRRYNFRIVSFSLSKQHQNTSRMSVVKTPFSWMLVILLELKATYSRTLNLNITLIRTAIFLISISVYV